jgi:uncharacterized heparinase superfamily protein
MHYGRPNNPATGIRVGNYPQQGNCARQGCGIPMQINSPSHRYCPACRKLATRASEHKAGNKLKARRRARRMA